MKFQIGEKTAEGSDDDYDKNHSDFKDSESRISFWRVDLRVERRELECGGHSE